MIHRSNFTKIDMHVHTCYTYGSSISLKNIEDFLKNNQDFGLAVTDINTIEGAMILNEKYPERIVVGSQIITQQGAITGLFLKEHVPDGKSLNWTIDAIIVQDGLVYLPHPLDKNRRTKISKDSLSLALKRCDIIEIFNSRTINQNDNKSAIDLLSPSTLPACGSDAHTKGELGYTYMKIPYGIKMNSESFFNALYKSELICKRTSTKAYVQTALYKKYKKIAKQ